MGSVALLGGACGGLATDTDTEAGTGQGAGDEDARREQQRRHSALCDRIERAQCGQASGETCLWVLDSEAENAASRGCGAEYVDFIDCRARVGFDCVRDNHIVWRSGCSIEHHMLEVCLEP